MNGIPRRGFVQSVTVALPVVRVVRSSDPGVGSGVPTGLDPVRLNALAAAVLPSELGPEGQARAAVGFRAWIEGYLPAAEADHGYGSGEIEYLAADPAPVWAAQLDALDLEARTRWGSGFAELDRGRRQELISRRLAADGPARLPAAQDAQHVALGLLAWFYAGPGATDLCYRARIGRQTCRDLAATAEEPPPWYGSRGS